MSDAPGGVIALAGLQAREAFDDPARGSAYWFTLFSGDRTPTSTMIAGLMVLPPGGGRLEPHRHAQAEIYFVAAGVGRLTVDGVETMLEHGAAAFIPGDALHGLTNDGPEELRIFYVFPADSVADVHYRFA